MELPSFLQQAPRMGRYTRLPRSSAEMLAARFGGSTHFLESVRHYLTFLLWFTQIHFGGDDSSSSHSSRLVPYSSASLSSTQRSYFSCLTYLRSSSLPLMEDGMTGLVKIFLFLIPRSCWLYGYRKLRALSSQLHRSSHHPVSSNPSRTGCHIPSFHTTTHSAPFPQHLPNHHPLKKLSISFTFTSTNRLPTSKQPLGRRWRRKGSVQSVGQLDDGVTTAS